MKCVKCLGCTVVVNSRDVNGSRRRRRECKECGYRFSTIESEVGVASDGLEDVKSAIIDVARMLDGIKAGSVAR